MSETKIVILDTNIVLDLFLFQDPRTDPLRQQLQAGLITWRATQHMRNELERVLTYPHIAAKLNFYNKTPADILTQFDHHAQLTPAPSAKAPYTCKDADDQVFIDLAASLAQQNPQERIWLISKDKAVLSMRKRLEKLSMLVTSRWSVDKNVSPSCHRPEPEAGGNC
jgi:predicted nucleic acid-binding protein